MGIIDMNITYLIGGAMPRGKPDPITGKVRPRGNQGTPRNKECLIGQTFNHLTVIAKSDHIAVGSNGVKLGPTWVCQCVCGNTREVLNKHLKNGSTVSCGCMRKVSSRIGSLAAAKKKSKGTDWVNSAAKKKFTAFEQKCIIRGKKTSLTQDQFKTLVTSNCQYCGKKPMLDPKDRNMSTKDLNGVDRVDSSIGYLIDNCVPCCKYCNYAKNDMTVEEFKAHITAIYNNLNKSTT